MPAHANPEVSDPFHLNRFCDAQGPVYDTVVAELRAGRKESHWMWFIFPQIAGLGSSVMARNFALRDLEEAAAYLSHPVLGIRLRECCRILLGHSGRTAEQILGGIDAIKLRSSMTLFARVPGAGPEFQAVLDRFHGGSPDSRTLEILGR